MDRASRPSDPAVVRPRIAGHSTPVPLLPRPKYAGNRTPVPPKSGARPSSASASSASVARPSSALAYSAVVAKAVARGNTADSAQIELEEDEHNRADSASIELEETEPITALIARIDLEPEPPRVVLYRADSDLEALADGVARSLQDGGIMQVLAIDQHKVADRNFAYTAELARRCILHGILLIVCSFIPDLSYSAHTTAAINLWNRVLQQASASGPCHCLVTAKPLFARGKARALDRLGRSLVSRGVVLDSICHVDDSEDIVNEISAVGEPGLSGVFWNVRDRRSIRELLRDHRVLCKEVNTTCSPAPHFLSFLVRSGWLAFRLPHRIVFRVLVCWVATRLLSCRASVKDGFLTGHGS